MSIEKSLPLKRIKYSLRFEYGVYQFLDHYIGRNRVFRLFGKRRGKFQLKLKESLKASGVGKAFPIERRKDLTLGEFKESYMKKGIPVVFEGQANDWDCVKKWSFDYFKELYGNEVIVMADTIGSASQKDTKTLREIIEDIESGGNRYYKFYPLLKKHPEHIKDFDYPWLHKRKNFHIFLEVLRVFMGSKKIDTPLHCENTSNLFVQVYGVKKWVLFPSGYSAIIDPKPPRNFYRGFASKAGNSSFDFFNPVYEGSFEILKYLDSYTVELNPGDILWTPPFYWHTVKNESDSIGVGYRWISPFYAMKIAPLYMFLDLFATFPPIWKLYKFAKEENLTPVLMPARK
jgi:hypothetical protein